MVQLGGLKIGAQYLVQHILSNHACAVIRSSSVARGASQGAATGTYTIPQLYQICTA